MLPADTVLMALFVLAATTSGVACFLGQYGHRQCGAAGCDDRRDDVRGFGRPHQQSGLYLCRGLAHHFPMAVVMAGGVEAQTAGCG